MASEEDKAFENLLEIQLKDQRESLSAIEEALASDPSNLELLSVHEELVGAIKDVEEGLLHLKRARLLQEADVVLHGLNNAAVVKSEHVDPANESDGSPDKIEEKKDLDGSMCRFRHTDGRWYNGRIIGFEGSDSAKITFLTPTSESMMMCKFFMQQRCRFGSSCRLSHGLDVPISSLKSYEQTEWKQSMVGSKIWAVSGSKYDIWRVAELESWDDTLQVGGVVFRDDGSSAKLGSDAMVLSEYAQMTDGDGEEEDEEEEEEEEEEEGRASGSEESVSSDYDEESIQGIGVLESTIQQRGVQTDTAIFAKWENHTRGIASKLMASMGYREGMGLGASGQGRLDPIIVKVLPSKRSLDHALEHIKNGEDKSEKPKKKRSRGGKRKRGKKFAEAARAAKQEEESKPDLFTLINNYEKVNSRESVKKRQNNGPVDRKALVAYEDEVSDLKSQVKKLEEMVNRNKKDQIFSDAATKRLKEVRKALACTLAAQASASNVVESKEKEKKWLKF